MDYKHAAQQVLDCIGGKDNILSAAHCATRLRLVIADNAKVNKQELENAEGTKGVFEAQGQLQIIFGTGTVNKVYDEFIQLAGIEGGSKEDVKQAAAAKAPWYQRAIKTLGDIFVPIIPAIVASGLLMGIMEALNFMVNNGFLNIDTTGSVYVFAKLFSNTAYTFLPILIAYSAAKVFGGNPYLGAVIGMIMIHPDLQNAWTVSNGVNVMQPVFGGLYSVPLVGYQGHVIPVIIAVWLMCQIEKRLHKVVPAMFDLFVTPLVSVFVTGYLTLAAIGPVFTKLENGIITGVQTLITLPYGIGSFIMGGLYAVTVVAGIHHMYTLIDLGQLARYGYTYWLPLASAANVAQGGAALAVALKSKDTKVKSMALPSALSACMGITEPAIFGVNLRYFKPFLGGLLGGDVGHVVGGIDHEGDAVNGEGECFQAEFFNFLVLQRAARVADLDEPFAHLLYAHAGTAARHGDADIGIGGHDAFGGFLHDRDMGGASGDIQSAFHAFKGIKGGGHGGGGQKERCGESGEQELFHGVLTRYK